MNFFLAVVTTLLVAIHEIPANPVSPNEVRVPLFSHSDCREKSGVDEYHILNPHKALQSEDLKFKEYLLCFLQKSGYVNELGEFQHEPIRKQLNDLYEDQSVVEVVLKECVVKENIPLEAALGFYKCYHRYYPQEGFLYKNSFTDNEKEKLSQIHAKCREESSFEDSLMEQFKAGNFDHPLGKKHLQCVYKETGLFDESGNFNQEKIREKLSQFYPDTNLVQQYLNKCLIKKDSSEETTYYLQSCLYENTPHKFNVFSVL